METMQKLINICETEKLDPSKRLFLNRKLIVLISVNSQG